MTVLAATLMLTIVPYSPPAETHVDLIELNHVYDTDDGHITFDQWIFWDWWPARRRYVCVAWRHYRADDQLLHGRLWVLVRHEQGVMRVSADSVIETWTPNDPELDDRERFAPSLRRGLRFQR